MIIFNLRIAICTGTSLLQKGVLKLTHPMYYSCMIPLALFFMSEDLANQIFIYSNWGLVLILLTLLLWAPTYWASIHVNYQEKSKIYAQLLSLLILRLCWVFVRDRMIVFFIFFEISLVPVLLKMYIGGKAESKKEAGLFLFFFTSTSSILFLILLVLLRLGQGGLSSYSMVLVSSKAFIISSSVPFLYAITTVVFLVKTPLFFLHIWLPKAHVEAPVFVSIILARLLLKTGGYGCYLITIHCFNRLALIDFCFALILFLAIVPAVCSSSQRDLKVLIAYSSVNHIGVILLGIFLGLSSSSLGGLIIMLGHGLLSSSIFFLARDRYDQTGRRGMFFSITPDKVNSNLVYWLLLTLINAGLPPFLIFIGEVLIFQAILLYPFLVIVGLFNYVIIGFYSCLILTHLALGKVSNSVGRIIGKGIRIYKKNIIILIHLAPLVSLGSTIPWIL